MEQKVILKTRERCIFLIRESKIDFYLVIPNSKKVSLVLGIFQNIQEEMVKNITNYSDKAIVLPILSEQVLEGVKTNQSSCFEYLDRFLSVLINSSYKILSFNHIEVSEKILLHNNSEYNSFNQWFQEKYHGRIELTNLASQPQPSFTNPKTSESNPLAQATFTNQVETSNIKTENNKDMNRPENNLSNENVSKKESNTKEPGFVSYVLLGVVVAVVSLVFLYLII